MLLMEEKRITLWVKSEVHSKCRCLELCDHSADIEVKLKVLLIVAEDHNKFEFASVA